MRIIIIFALLFIVSINSQAQIINASQPYRPFAPSCSYLLDQYSGAAAAYSLRKLDCDYTGYAIRVRRSSDNSEQDIGFTSNGDLDTATLKTFVGANNGFVVTWYDQSSNANNATQTTAGNQPLIISSGVVLRSGGLPSIYFYSERNFIITPLTSRSNFSIFAIQNRSATNVELCAMSNNTKYEPISAIQYHDGNVYLGDGLNYVYTSDGLTGIRQFSSFRISGALTLYRDGSLIANSNSSFPGGAAEFNSIGKRQGTYSTGFISEIIYYPSDQISNRTGIESNINSYY